MSIDTPTNQPSTKHAIQKIALERSNFNATAKEN